MTNTTNLRPAELVAKYLETDFKSSPASAGSRLPTIQELAKRVGVSPSTVRSVYREMAAQGKIEASRGRGTFLKNSELEARRMNIAVNLAPLEENDPGAPWSESIYIGAVREAAKTSRLLSFVPVAAGMSSENRTSAITDSLLSDINHLDGAILFPIATADQIREQFEKARKPIISINAPSWSSTINFVSTDFFGDYLRLGSWLRKSGKLRPLILLSEPVERYVSHQLLVAGLLAGFNTAGTKTPDIRIEIADGGSSDDGYQKARRHVSRANDMPDVIICSGDYLAIGVLAACKEVGLRAPDDIEVCGGTGLDSTASNNPEITLLRQPLEMIGQAAVQMLTRRLTTGSASQPGIYLNSTLQRFQNPITF